MRKGSKMSKAQRIKHGKAIKAGWARRKKQEGAWGIGKIDPWPANKFAFDPKTKPTLRSRIAAIVREEVDKRLDELFA